MKNTKNGKIRIGIPEKIISDLRIIYGNTIDIDAKIEEVLRNFIDARAALEPTLQPDLDAHTTEEENDDVFCSPLDVFPTMPNPLGVLSPDNNVFPDVGWNGNKYLNTVRAKAQVMHLLNPRDYHGLGKRLMDNILSIVENKNIVEVKRL